MATRHDRREQVKKDQRKRQQRHVVGKRVTPGWVAPLVLAVVAIAAILGLREIGVLEPPPPAITPPPAATIEKIGTKYPDEGSEHVPQTERVQYARTPPTSGKMWGAHATWGVKDSSYADELVVHGLEHGGIVISYRGLSPDDLANLKTLVRRFNAGEYKKVMLRPYDRMENGIVLTAWLWSHRVERYDEATITKFVQGHYGQRGEAPEANAQ